MPRQRKRSPPELLDLGTFSGKDLAPRRARAYVPSRSGEGKRSVLVMFDGQNVFGDEGSFAGGWYAHEAVEKLAAAQAPIIVAIDHGGAERIAELGAPNSPKAAAFVDLVVDGVLPAAHARLALEYGPGAPFAAEPRSRETIACGSSMGGLFALYIHFRRPEVFGGAIAMSPSLWYGRRAVDGSAAGGTSRASIVDFVASQTNPYRSRVWLDAGEREAGGRLVGAVQSMGRALRERGWSTEAKGDLRLAVDVDPRGKHDEASWRRRLPKALRFAFAS